MKSTIVDCFHFREVFYNLLSQELKLKYKRTALGYLWSLLNPILQLAVLSAVFSNFVGRGMKDYAVYLFSGMLAWNFLQGSFIASTTALIENESFIKKVYLPKAIFPLGRVCMRIVDFFFSLVALTLIGIVLHFPFHATLVAVPLAAVLLFLFVFGCSLIICVATVYFRDVQYLLTVFLQLGYFVTPILYPASSWPPEFAPFFRLNPVYWLMNLFQKLIYYGQWPGAGEWMIGAAVALLALAAGLFVLVRFEEDVVFRL